jgi:hypothetical protein
MRELYIGRDVFSVLSEIQRHRSISVGWHVHFAEKPFLRYKVRKVDVDAAILLTEDDSAYLHSHQRCLDEHDGVLSGKVP